MKISSKSIVAVSFMVQLAKQANQQPLPIKEAAALLNVSSKYLEQVTLCLNSAGLIRAIRGSKGGYLLNKPARNITVGDVLRTTERHLSLFEEIDENDPAKALWLALDQSIQTQLDGTNIQTLADQSSHLVGDYVI